jgi:competence ComEA-like helix-hairpin-helix protein
LPREQKLVAAGVLLAQLVLLSAWFTWGGKRELVDIDHPPRLDARFLIDINAASASEFALLPDIGETLAARIVAWREEHGGFNSIEELRRLPRSDVAARGFSPVTSRIRSAPTSRSSTRRATTSSRSSSSG